MKLAIMQPYFLPYIGYFQLCYAADKFVFADNLNFISSGWINRNYILLDNKPYLFTIPLKKASYNKKINAIETAIDEKWLRGFFKKLEHSYHKALNYEPVILLLRKVLDGNTTGIGELAKQSVYHVCNYLGMTTPIVDSSSIYNNAELKREERIFDICTKENAATYINPIGGTALYSQSVFQNKGVELKFLKTNPQLKYNQFNDDFVPSLSIIDVLMFNSIEQIFPMLSNFELV